MSPESPFSPEKEKRGQSRQQNTFHEIVGVEADNVVSPQGTPGCLPGPHECLSTRPHLGARDLCV